MLKITDVFFEEVWKAYLKDNPLVIVDIIEESSYLSEIFRITRHEYILFELNRAFEAFCSMHKRNLAVGMIELSALKSNERMKLIRDFYQQEAMSLGYDLEDFIIVINIKNFVTNAWL